ncbi:agamous MADS-box protein AGL80 [Trifolium repens]|nr:agamous MADS-box protein AGL80 [Trifolium repens]
MARKTLKLEYITNQSKRNATYKRRKNGLLKKVYELITLCGIEACLIIYGENNVQPEVFPPGPIARNVLGKFLSLPEIERNKKMLDSEGFLKQKILKTQKLLMKQIDENKKKSGILISNVSKYLYCNIGDVNVTEANNLTGFIEKKLNQVEQKLRSMKIQAQEETENGTEAVNETTNEGHVADK